MDDHLDRRIGEQLRQRHDIAVAVRERVDQRDPWRVRTGGIVDADLNQA
jgi:hypothetical protein